MQGSGNEFDQLRQTLEQASKIVMVNIINLISEFDIFLLKFILVAQVVEREQARPNVERTRVPRIPRVKVALSVLPVLVGYENKS